MTSASVLRSSWVLPSRKRSRSTNSQAQSQGGLSRRGLVLCCCLCKRLPWVWFLPRLLMEELVHFIERVPKAQSASLWKDKDIQR